MWERRVSRRVDVLGREAACTGAAISGMYPIANLSPEGALLVGGAVAPVGEQLDIELEADCGDAIELTGRAVRHCVSPAGQRMFGVKFDPTSVMTGALVEQIIHAETKCVTRPVLVVARYGYPGKKLLVDLRAIGRRATTVTTAHGALEYLAGLDRVETVVVDASRPDLDGVALLAEIARRFAAIHRVVMSGPIPSLDAAHALEIGAAHAEVGPMWTLESLDDALTSLPRVEFLRATSRL